MNLAFSSIEEHQHGDVIDRCYRPLLELPHRIGAPIAIEATATTLERIGELRPTVLETLRSELAGGTIELVGSGYAQCIAPLLPAYVNRWNLQLGRVGYQELLGAAPRVALVNEQAYTDGVASLYREAGYEALIADWENAARANPWWPERWRAFPQRAADAEIAVLWSRSVAFQQLQAHVHGALDLVDYLAHVRSAASDHGVFLVYSNDAEVFGFRPGRFEAEAALQEDEWGRVAHTLNRLAETGVGRFGTPSEALAHLGADGAGNAVRLASAARPTVVKKQDKYNIVRWAVSGRGDTDINTRCWRVAEAMRAGGCEDPAAWRLLCRLFASDYRTHITETRWARLQRELAQAERRWTIEAALPPAAARRPRAEPPAARHQPRGGAQPRIGHRGALLVIGGDGFEAALDLSRGLAVEHVVDRRVSPVPMFGRLPQGYFPTIRLAEDFCSGHLVCSPPARHAVSDLTPVEPEVDRDGGTVRAEARIDTAFGPLLKTVTVEPERGSVGIEFTLAWDALPEGAVRLGFVTVNPAAFDIASAAFACHNGGETPELFRLGTEAFDHGAPVSSLVSANQGLGVTEGVLRFGDTHRSLAVEFDQGASRLLGMARHEPLDGRWLARVWFSVAEHDDTRRGPIALVAPLVARLQITAAERAAGDATPSLAFAGSNA